MEALTAIVCPECGGDHINKNGTKEIDGFITQTYLCRGCGYHFRKNLKANQTVIEASRIGVFLQDMKNLAPTAEIKTVGDAKKVSPEAQIVNYLIHLKNNGRRDTTIESRDWQIRRIVSLGADLNDPESVKKAIATLERTESYKLLLCLAYDGFCKANGLSWIMPNYKQSEPLPFCPLESEIDALIANCNPKTATLLRLLKETAMRLGEAWQVEWQDFNAKNRTLVCKNPEKNSRPRIFDNLSIELCEMLETIPHNSQYIFTTSRIPIENEDRKIHLRYLRRQKSILGKQRMRTAYKLKNPRIKEISYHSCRHWKATQLYHRTLDILHVMKFLGHRSVKNTLIYIDLERLVFPKGDVDYTGKVAKTPLEKLALIEAGFEFVQADPDGTSYYRKRK